MKNEKLRRKDSARVYFSSWRYPALTVLALITVFMLVIEGVPLIVKVGFFQIHFRDEMGAQPGLLTAFFPMIVRQPSR